MDKVVESIYRGGAETASILPVVRYYLSLLVRISGSIAPSWFPTSRLVDSKDAGCSDGFQNMILVLQRFWKVAQPLHGVEA